MDSFANYKINHTKYLDVMRRYKSKDGKDKDKCEKIMKILEDPNVYREVSSALEVLQPISLALDKVKDYCRLSSSKANVCATN
jgi:histidinol phosphatase-like PHP family hydrolase